MRYRTEPRAGSTYRRRRPIVSKTFDGWIPRDTPPENGEILGVAGPDDGLSQGYVMYRVTLEDPVYEFVMVPIANVDLSTYPGYGARIVDNSDRHGDPGDETQKP